MSNLRFEPMKKLFSLFLVVAFFFGASLALATTVLAAPPANFQTEQLITDGLDGPSGFEIAPDGRVFILQRTGEIKIYKNGVLLPDDFAVLPSIASGDRGLIGIAFDPEFDINNHYVYFYYTGLDKKNRLVRFDASTDIGQDFTPIYQTNSPSENLHVGGSIRFGPDGKMYFAVGDNGYPPNAQNLSNPHGKILRINKDGSIPLDNPFYGQPGALPEIWAYGMRNPWRFQFDSTTGRLYGGDVGDFTWEEVNLIQKGKNYGWPTYEGYCVPNCGTTVEPIYAYNHHNESAAVTGGPVYRKNMFPAPYQGSYFFGDYAKGMIRYMTLDANGYTTSVNDFDMNAGSVVDLKVAPDGSLYYITYWPGRLYRVSYTLGNHIPTANATADKLKGIQPLIVNFSSAGSIDPDGDPLTYLWKFGDGTTSTLANPTKTYNNKGAYTVDLTVSDGPNNAHSVPLVIQVGIPPTVTIYEPTNGSTYHAGDTIHYTVFGLDGAGFDLNDANLSTEIILHHDTHSHPFVGPIIGRQGTFTIPTTGEPSANTWFEIKTTGTDGNGLSTTKSTLIYPQKSTFTLKTQPAGLNVSLDGVPKQTPVTIEGVVGFKRELNAPAVQTVNGKQYQFLGWSDNGAQKHFMTTEATNQTYTANFIELQAFNAEYYNNTDLQGAPALVRQDNAIDFNWVNDSPTPAINTDNFSVRWTRTQYFGAGQYQFSATADDGVRLYVDNQLIIDEWHGGSAVYNATITLAGGQHTIKVEYMEQYAFANIKLDWVLTQNQPQLPEGYNATYYDNATLTGAPTVTRIDPTINFDWGAGSSDANIQNDTFSARWTKEVTLPAGVYEFSATGDDGVRLYVDNELLIDKWVAQSATTYKATKQLAEGNHTITFEYYENVGDAVAKMNYVKIGDIPPADGFAAEYFTNKTLTGAPAVTRIDPTINFDWGAGSPHATIQNDNFSARWTKTASFENANYEFTVTADDGVRLKVDGVVILDKWIDQAPTTYKVTKALTAGNHTIVMEYFETGGGAVAKLNYEKTNVAPPPAGAYTAEYFNNQNLTAPATVTRNDAAIDFDWGGGSPDGLINPNNFSARWTKTATFEASDYEFTVTADDGIRVKLDGVVILDKWIDQPPTTYKVTKPVTAGNHTLVVEYYENGGGAVAKVNYEKTTVAPPPPPATDKYVGEYFNNKTLAGTPVLTRNDDTIDFDWGTGTPDASVPANEFSVRWTKTYAFEAGTYKFTTTSDDGIRVYVDNDLVIDQWNDHGPTLHIGEKTLTAGNHVIKVEYYEGGWTAVAKFNFEKVTAPAAENPYTAEFFNNINLTGPAVVTRQEDIIAFDWKDGSPDPLIQNEHFSARFTKQQHFTAGQHTFLVTADDGVRVYVDNQMIIDKWVDQSSMNHNATINLTEGMHTIKVEYYENYVDAKLIFQIL